MCFAGEGDVHFGHREDTFELMIVWNDDGETNAVFESQPLAQRYHITEACWKNVYGGSRQCARNNTVFGSEIHKMGYTFCRVPIGTDTTGDPLVADTAETRRVVPRQVAERHSCTAHASSAGSNGIAFGVA